MKNKYRERFEDHKYLFHYTTVESLLFILVNKVLKFNKVDNFNDLSESIRNVYVKFFASCLTYSAEESIPLWHIYANKENGIRIGFPNKEIFNGDFYFFNDNGEKEEVDFKSIGNVLYGQVEYNDELVLKSPSEGTDFVRLTNVYHMACQKRKVWAYEEEVRFFVVDNEQYSKNAKCLYFKLNNDFFDSLTITFNPFMPEYKKSVIKEFVRSLNLNNIKFEESSLKGTIR